jgi:hypothetical protein
MSWEALLAIVLAAASPSPSPVAGTSAAADVVTGPGGYVRVSEIGHPPLGMSGARARTIARENASRRARERLLKAILALQLKNGRKLEQAIKERPDLRAGLRAVLGGATLTGAELAGDSVELTLTVRMEGVAGLAQYLDSVQVSEPRGQ